MYIILVIVIDIKSKWDNVCKRPYAVSGTYQWSVNSTGAYI